MKYLLLSVILLCSFTIHAQESTHKKSEENANAPHHRITFMMMNAHLPNSIEIKGTNKTFLVPAWGIDYDYWFNGKWAVGLHSDLILQQYKVEKVGTEAIVIRDYPVSASIVGLYKATKHLVLIAGIGREFEANENINLIDFGVEYGWELPKNWELSLNVKYENKIKTYDSYLFGIGISKNIFKKKRG
ncbi:MAG: hypothetical protein ACOYKE_01440 [Ferruginibacter sp.]